MTGENTSYGDTRSISLRNAAGREIHPRTNPRKRAHAKIVGSTAMIRYLSQTGIVMREIAVSGADACRAARGRLGLPNCAFDLLHGGACLCVDRLLLQYRPHVEVIIRQRPGVATK